MFDVIYWSLFVLSVILGILIFRSGLGWPENRNLLIPYLIVDIILFIMLLHMRSVNM